MTKLFEIKNISKAFQSGKQKVEAVKNVSFTVNQGEIIVITGKSGSGKSTLLNVIGGLMTPEKGEVLLNGVSMYDLKENERCTLRSKSIGFIFQQFNLIKEMSVLSNIRLPFDIQGIDYDIKYEEKIIDMLEIKERLSFFPDQLSGGEQQRVATARALLTKPSVVLADEPTGNLDVDSGNRIKDFVKTSNDTEKQTFIIVTHDLEWTEIAHRRLTMQDGILLEEA